MCVSKNLLYHLLSKLKTGLKICMYVSVTVRSALPLMLLPLSQFTQTDYTGIYVGQLLHPVP